MGESAFVFFQFFQRLREEVGIELDGKQFEAFLELFLKGLGGNDQESIRQLCRTLWLTRPKYSHRFDEVFDEIWPELEQYLALDNTPDISPNPPVPNPPIVDPSTKQPSSPSPLQEKANPSNKRTGNFQEIMLSFSEQGSFTVEDEPPERETAKLDHPYIFNDRFFPISRRRAVQTWRRIKSKTNQTPTKRIDPEKTIEQIAKQGYLESLAYHSISSSRQKVCFLVDRFPSMLAFQSLADHLYHTYNESQAQTPADRFYFLNYPTKKQEDHRTTYQFYHDKNCRQAIAFQQLLKQYSPSTLLIFSGAGVNHAESDPAFFDHFLGFLEKGKQMVKSIVWLNPYPDYRWPGTLADYFSSVVHMYPITSAGLLQAVKHIQ